MIAGRTGDRGARRGSRPATLTPQSRGSAAVVEVLDPQPGEHVLDLCAGPGIKTGQIAARMGDRGEVISVELDPARAGRGGRAGAAARAAQRHRDRGRRGGDGDGARGFDRVLLDAPCSDLGALASRPDARWRKSPQTIERLVDVQTAGARAAPPGRCGRAAPWSTATCTISRRENEDRVAALLAAAEVGEVPPLDVEDLGARAPALASPLDPRFLQLRPDRDRTTGFFICRPEAG